MGKESLLKKYDLTIECLDYKFIENCRNEKLLEKILGILRSGEEGTFPDLIKFCERELKKLHPESRLLNPIVPALRYSEIPKLEREKIFTDIGIWAKETDELEAYCSKNASILKAENDLPIRNINVSVENKKLNTSKTTLENRSGLKNSIPRDFKEWDKFNVDEELKKLDDKEEECHEKVPAPDKTHKELPSNLNIFSLSDYECKYLANLERIKGNEAFKAQDFKEAILYYTRSLSAYKTISSLNNRGISYMKIKHYVAAILDFNTVLCIEPNNIKALYRRGVSYKEQNAYGLAMLDFEMMDQNNKSVKEQIEQIKNLEAQRNVENKKSVFFEEIDDYKEHSDTVKKEKLKIINDQNVCTRLTIEEVSDTEVDNDECNSIVNRKIAVVEETQSDENMCASWDTHLQTTTKKVNLCDNQILKFVIGSEICLDFSETHTVTELESGENKMQFKESKSNRHASTYRSSSDKYDYNTCDLESKFPPKIASMLKICHSSIDNLKKENSKDARVNFDAIDNESTCRISNTARKQKSNYGVISGSTFIQPIITEIFNCKRDKPLQQEQVGKGTVNEFLQIEIKPDITKALKTTNVSSHLKNQHEVTHKSGTNNKTTNDLYFETFDNKNKSSEPCIAFASETCLETTAVSKDVIVKDLSQSILIEDENEDQSILIKDENEYQSILIKDENEDWRRQSNKKISPFEFFHFWSSVKAKEDSKAASKYLELISPNQLLELVSNKLDINLLMGMLKAIHNMMQNGKYAESYAYLKSIMNIPRLSIVAMFLSPTEQIEIQALFNLLETKKQYRTESMRLFKEIILQEGELLTS